MWAYSAGHPDHRSCKILINEMHTILTCQSQYNNDLGHVAAHAAGAGDSAWMSIGHGAGGQNKKGKLYNFLGEWT